jgi:hypothetical protein
MSETVYALMYYPNGTVVANVRISYNLTHSIALTMAIHEDTLVVWSKRKEKYKLPRNKGRVMLFDLVLLYIIEEQEKQTIRLENHKIIAAEPNVHYLSLSSTWTHSGDVIVLSAWYMRSCTNAIYILKRSSGFQNKTVLFLFETLGCHYFERSASSIAWDKVNYGLIFSIRPNYTKGIIERSSIASDTGGVRRIKETMVPSVHSQTWLTIATDPFGNRVFSALRIQPKRRVKKLAIYNIKY